MVKIKKYCDEIINCMITYGGISSDQAHTLLGNSHLCKEETVPSNSMFFHESPYYWAMLLIHQMTNPGWPSDPKLWPPPDGYYEELYSMHLLDDDEVNDTLEYGEE